MAVEIVPSNEVIVNGDSFILNPNPGAVKYQDSMRMGPNPMLYETINPGLKITVVATGGCPEPGLPDLITGIELVPGQNNGEGIGNSIVQLVDIADKEVVDIPEFAMDADWDEPRMEYGSIRSGPVKTLDLVTPLRGYYGEKYFYDAEYIYASYYRNTPEFQGDFYKSIEEGIVPEVNRLTAISLLDGRRILEFKDIPEGITQIDTEYFPKDGIPIELEELSVEEEAEVLTTGNDYIEQFIPEISSWVKWRPSFIELMRYYYTLVVTHTCPPFVTTFEGSMIIQNNWTPAANRLSYYIDKQVGFLDNDT